MPDLLKPALIIGLSALAIAVICLIMVAWANSNSQSVALATSTLVAAAILFMTQLSFELREQTVLDFISAEYTVNHEKLEIHQWGYPDSASWRGDRETKASAWLAKTNPAAFQGDGAKLINDMTIFSLISYLGAEQFDWQLKRTKFKGPGSGSLTLTQPVSPRHQCAEIAPKALSSMLSSADNSFSDAEIWIFGGRLCLPPSTTVAIENGSISIETPYCTIQFSLVSSGAVSYEEPGSGGHVPELPNGKPKLETRLVGINAVITYSRIRAHNRQMRKYQQWSEGLVDGAKRWFEGSPKT